MSLLCRLLQLPRQGYSLEECQDAAASDPEQGRFAIADGATESPHAALWAHLLVQAFVHPQEEQATAPGGVPPEIRVPWADWLPPIQQRWASAVLPRLEDPPLPWYLEPGLQQGAFATFLGVVVRKEQTISEPRPQGSGDLSPLPCGRGSEIGDFWLWEAVALGDSCLFQTRDDELVQTFPVRGASDFTSTPWLVGSRTAPRRGGEVCQGEFRPQDRLWLMTDALAQWFLTQFENGGKPWQIAGSLLDRSDPRMFADWVEQQRHSRQLRNDDVTLMAVRRKDEG